MPSTAIKSFSYNSKDKRLRVVFISGTVYDYLEVPQKIYGEMKAAFSKGTFLNQNIKPNYSFEKVG